MSLMGHRTYHPLFTLITLDLATGMYFLCKQIKSIGAIGFELRARTDIPVRQTKMHFISLREQG